MLAILLVTSVLVSGQNSKFIINGKLKVDGGSVSDAKIIVERDGRQVKSIEGQSRFDIDLDFQSIYVISFVKEGFVTKRLRFDTNVPKDRIDYGFEPFGFQVEIFEQYDDVNMVVFNQPVGKISYSELIDEFDYDTDYTKTIQTQLDQAQKDVQAAKEKKSQEAQQNQKKIADLTDKAEDLAKDGNYSAAIGSLEEALKLEKKPEITKQIETYKQAEQAQKKQDEFQDIVKDAEAAMAAGDLDEAKKLFEQANGVIGGDKKVQAQLANIESEKAKQQQTDQAFDAASTAAQDALKAGNYNQAIIKADEALKLRSSPEMESLRASAQKAQKDVEAAAAAEAIKVENYQALVAEGDKAFAKDEFEAAISKYNEAQSILAKPELDEKIKSVQKAIAMLEEEQRKQADAQAELDGAIQQAESNLAAGDLNGAKAALDNARAIRADDRIEAIAEAISKAEMRLAQETKALAEKDEKINSALSEAEAALNSGDLDNASAGFKRAGELGADPMRVEEGLLKVEEEKDRIAAEKEAEAEAAAEKKAQIDALITEAEGALNTNDFGAATAKLDEAEALGADDRIAELRKQVNKAEAEQLKVANKQEEIEQQYNDLVAEGQSALASGMLVDAEKAFNKALALNVDGAEAKAGLEQVNAARAEEAAQQESNAAQQEAALAAAAMKEREANYRKILAKAQKALDVDNLELAESAFNEAQAYSDDPIEAVNGLAAVADRRVALSNADAETAAAEQAAERSKVFEEAVKRGDEAAAQNRLEEAITAYGEALGIKSNDVVQSKLDEVLERKDALANKEKNQKEAEQVKDDALQQEEADRLAAEKQAASAAEAARKAREVELAQKKAAFETEKAAAEKLFQANKLNEARVAYERALSYFPEDTQVESRIEQIDALREKLVKEREKNQEAAVAITENRGRETEQLANIIAEEDAKSSSKEPSEVKSTNPGEVKMAQAVMEQDVRPGSSSSSPVVISDLKVGDAARKSRSAQMTEDEVYDGIVKRTDEQQAEALRDEQQQKLMETYRQRKTVETDSVDNTLVTQIFINNGQFVTIYKKVEHSWGGEYFFIDGRATNRRYWEHETR